MISRYILNPEYFTVQRWRLVTLGRMAQLVSFMEPELRFLSTRAKTKSGKERSEHVIATCATDCGGTCPLLVHLEKGVIRKITPYDDGKTPPLKPCIRGLKSHYRIYAPDRLKYPLRRVGERGCGKFRRISWEEAFQSISGEMQRIKRHYGADAILECSGAGSILVFLHPTEKGSLFRLLNDFGGRTALGTNTSFEGAVWASWFTYGSETGEDANSLSDLLNSKLIILWGLNPAENRFGTETLYWLKRARDRGIKIIVVDPCLTDSVRVLEAEWIPIRPSTDTAMLNAMAYVIFREGLFDREYIERHVSGTEEYWNYLMGETDGVEKTVHWAQRITGVPAERIVTLTREYALSKPAALIQGWAPGRTAAGEQYHRAAIALQALTGNIGVRGGSGSCCGVQKSGGNGKPSLWDMLSGLAPAYDSRLKAGGKGTEINAGRWAEAVLQGRSGGFPSDIRMIYVSGHNILNQRANPRKGIEAFKKVDFVVCQELFMTLTARYSDIVLPVTTSFEREDIRIPWVKGYYIIYSRKVIDPLWECRSDLDVANRLSALLGISELHTHSDEQALEALYEKTFLHEHISFQELKRIGLFRLKEQPFIAFRDQIENNENNPFPTSTGKIEIYSHTLENIDFDDTDISPVLRGYRNIPRIPTFLSCDELPGSTRSSRYPLQLTTPHCRYRVHSQYANSAAMRKLYRHEVWIHRSDAEPRGIKNGDLVRIFNDRGAILIHAKVTERMMPGVVRCYEGAWYDPVEWNSVDLKPIDFQSADCNSGFPSDVRSSDLRTEDFGLYKPVVDRGGCVNVLLDDAITSAAGASNCNSCLVEIRKETI
jgi:anaerobic dimethyl sulfoxide reductase subunit A